MKERLEVCEEVDPDRLSTALREDDNECAGWIDGNDPRRSEEVYPVESDPALTLDVRTFSGKVPRGCTTPPVSVAMLCLRWYNEAAVKAGL